MLFEMLILEGMQAGLRWITILKKRESFRKAFDRFIPVKVAFYGEDTIQELLANEGSVRNSLKINAAITNAKAFLEVQVRKSRSQHRSQIRLAGFEEEGIQICRFDHYLRLHASHRYGERSCDGLFCVSGGEEGA